MRAKVSSVLLKRFLERQYLVDIKPSSVPKLPISIFLPYLGVYSIRLKKRFIKFLVKIYPPPNVDFGIVFWANKHIGSLFPFKDRVPSHVCSSIVNKFTCRSCQATDYGKTSRHFIFHFGDHLGINKKGSIVKGASGIILTTLVTVPP